MGHAVCIFLDIIFRDESTIQCMFEKSDTLIEHMAPRTTNINNFGRKAFVNSNVIVERCQLTYRYFQLRRFLISCKRTDLLVSTTASSFHGRRIEITRRSTTVGGRADVPNLNFDELKKSEARFCNTLQSRRNTETTFQNPCRGPNMAAIRCIQEVLGTVGTTKPTP
jgi:hypothetical protein